MCWACTKGVNRRENACSRRCATGREIEWTMRIFKIWTIAEAKVLIDGTERVITCAGGSNRSEADALADGMQRLEAVKRRIAGFKEEKGPDYEGDIREEPVRWLGSQDVVTRNRYGAEVLNSSSCIFIDIDEPVLHIWEIFRRLGTIAQRKRAILKFLETRTKRDDLNGYGIRVYETHSGIRVILDGQALDPRSRECKKLLRSFNADRLYSLLCRKQNCFRARLTPKPHRIKMHPIRLRYPYEEKDRERIKAWIREYDAKSERCSSCRLVQVLGNVPVSPAVLYHDERTRAHISLPLA